MVTSGKNTRENTQNRGEGRRDTSEVLVQASTKLGHRIRPGRTRHFRRATSNFRGLGSRLLGPFP